MRLFFLLSMVCLLLSCQSDRLDTSYLLPSEEYYADSSIYHIFEIIDKGTTKLSATKYSQTSENVEITNYDFNLQPIEILHFNPHRNQYVSGYKFMENQNLPINLKNTRPDSLSYSLTYKNIKIEYAEYKSSGEKSKLLLNNTPYDCISYTSVITSKFGDEEAEQAQSFGYGSNDKGVLFESYDFAGYQFEKKFIKAIGEKEFLLLQRKAKNDDHDLHDHDHHY